MNPPIEELYVPGDVCAQLEREARRCYPAESCGFLIGAGDDQGEGGGKRASVLELRPAENRARRPDRFFIEARDVFEAMRSARDRGQELLGIYHSHPRSGPQPSATDRADVWYEWLYVIVSVAPASTEGPSRDPASSGGPPRDPALSGETPRDPAPKMACWRWDGEQFAAVRLCATAQSGGAAPSRLHSNTEISDVGR